MSLLTSLVSYYKLEDTSDSAGSNTLTNNNSVTFTAGKIGNGADFGASNASKSLTNSSFVSIDGGAVTLSIWVKLNTEISSGSYGFINIGRNSSTYTDYYINYNYNGGTRQLSFQRHKQAGPDQGVAYTQTLGTSNWYHLVLTYDTTNVIGYVNGVSIGSAAASGSGGAGDTFYGLYIGINPRNAGSYASTIQDEVGIWSRALSADEVSQLFNSGRGNAYPLTDTPSLYGGVAYYKLDGNSNDAIGTNNGTDTAITYNASYGKINQGALFNGTSSTIVVADNVSLHLTNISVSVWFKLASLTDAQDVVTKWQDNSNLRSWILRLNPTSNTIVWISSSDGTGPNVFVQSVSYTFSLSTWYYITITYDSSGNAIFYINGSKVGTTQTGGFTLFAASTASLMISGRNPDVKMEFFNGDIDEVGIWSRALTSTEVTQLYNGGAGLQYPFSSNYTLTAAYATFALTGQTAFLRQGVRMIASMGSYVLTGFNTVFKLAGWKSQSKSSSTWSTQSKSSSTWTSQNKS